ncbi:hypothetical protein SEA_CHICKENKING_55 [Microbacterium phage ChickenKing]|nr:hypothetical protein SEA_CHICKENKING_55 [Microbacterium phage ChickenKing]
MAKYVTLNASSNAGYSADQVLDRTISLNDLLEQVQQAIEDHGGDTMIVLNDGQRYGANYGYLSQYEELFTSEPVECGTCGTEADYEDQEECRVCGEEL